MTTETGRHKMQQLSLGAGQWGRWCCHSQYADEIFCMNGQISITTRDPGTEIILNPGDSTAIPSGRIHYIAGVDNQPCQCIIVQMCEKVTGDPVHKHLREFCVEQW
jgi:mannose-6-phosphate isomerase-like protein (cupin superfamily)